LRSSSDGLQPTAAWDLHPPQP